MVLVYMVWIELMIVRFGFFVFSVVRILCRLFFDFNIMGLFLSFSCCVCIWICVVDFLFEI